MRSTIGTRDPEQTRAREQWAGIDLPLAAYQDLDAEVLINATSGMGSLAALKAVGDALNGKVVIDTSNALDFSHGFPPSLFISNTDSLAEQLQRELPEARLVKMFNTMANEVMVNPRGLGDDSTVFIAGNDAPHDRLRHHLLPTWAGQTCLIWAISPRPAVWRCTFRCGCGSTVSSGARSSTSSSSADRDEPKRHR